MKKSTLKEPITVKVKNADLYVSPYSAQINDVNISELVRKLTGDGNHRADICISIFPLNGSASITVGDNTEITEDLKGYIEEDKSE